jgi:homoserine acetyltransferase
MKVSKLKTEVSTTELLELFSDVADLPSLVIGGQQDSILPCRKVEAIHEHLPRSLLSLLPACGHLAHEECPRELLALLVPFVADAYSSRSLPSMAEELMMRTAI